MTLLFDIHPFFSFDYIGEVLDFFLTACFSFYNLDEWWQPILKLYDSNENVGLSELTGVFNVLS